MNPTFEQLGALLGSGKEAEIFEHGADVAKVYRSPGAKRAAFKEAACLALAESAGLPVPALMGVTEIGDRWAVLMARVDGAPFSDAMGKRPELVRDYLEAMAALHRRVHACSGEGLPRLKSRLEANIGRAGLLGGERQRRLLELLAEMPEGGALCHGDFHPLNVMGSIGRETLVDWVDAASGDPAADLCRSLVLMRNWSPELASGYVDIYVSLGDLARERVAAWLPVVAAARLAEGVPNETDALMAMAELG